MMDLMLRNALGNKSECKDAKYLVQLWRFPLVGCVSSFVQKKELVRFQHVEVQSDLVPTWHICGLGVEQTFGSPIIDMAADLKVPIPKPQT